MIRRRFLINLYVLALLISHSSLSQAGHFINVVAGVKPSVVAIGSFQKIRNPAISFSGTGFVVGDGLTVITNAHVLKLMKNLEQGEVLGVLAGNSKASEFRAATVVAIDEEHDLARLKISGAPLPSLKLGSNDQVSEGQAIAFTGFPLAISLGFHHATHRGFIASITPIVKPASGSNRLDSNVVAQLRKSSFLIYQLDATAYPGNSGSPMYDPETGTVIGVINMVFIKGLKETAITHPSGISYAIPVAYVNALLEPSPR